MPSSKASNKLPLKEKIAEILEDMQLDEIEHFDLKDIVSFADDMFLASGRSSRHLHASADEIRLKLKHDYQIPVHIEGLDQAEWILIDAGDVIIHLFKPEVRAFYQLDKLWGSFEQDGDEEA